MFVSCWLDARLSHAGEFLHEPVGTDRAKIRGAVARLDGSGTGRRLAHRKCKSQGVAFEDTKQKAQLVLA